VAVKVASITEMGLEGWRTEVKALQKLHHPNIIRLLGSVRVIVNGDTLLRRFFLCLSKSLVVGSRWLAAHSTGMQSLSIDVLFGVGVLLGWGLVIGITTINASSILLHCRVRNGAWRGLFTFSRYHSS
jgi:hypothetical protein